MRRLKTHCKRGHELSEGNYWLLRNSNSKLYRACKLCRQEKINRRRVLFAKKRVTSEMIADAVAAYQAGIPALEIEGKFGVPNQTLYRHMPGLPRLRSLKPKPPRLEWCAWCGDPLKPEQKKFCCRACVLAFQRDDNRQWRERAAA